MTLSPKVSLDDLDDAHQQALEEINAIAVGLNLLRAEMHSGDLKSADVTWATIQRCLDRLTDGDLLSLISDKKRDANWREQNGIAGI